LHRREELVIVALGDSITAGLGLEDPAREAFPHVFATVLREAYGHSWIHLLNRGHPGETAEQGLNRLAGEVLAYHPDLVIVLFGGNDYRAQRQPDELAADLRTIVWRIRASTDAAVLLATPPWEGQEPDTPYVQAVRAVGKAERVVVADFDAALRRAERDARGLFAYQWDHPNEYSHAVMARELLRAWHELVGQRPSLRVELPGAAWLAPLGEFFQVPVAVSSAAPGPQAVSVRVSNHAPLREQSVEVEGRRVIKAAAPLLLPHYLPDGRAQQQRLLAVARSGDAVACDVKWLTLAPALACERTRGPAFMEDQPGPIPPERRLGVSALVLGPECCISPADLSAAFRVSADEQYLYLSVRVWDDVLTFQKNAAFFENDGVEFYLDLRALPHQGKPFYDENVLLLHVNPGWKEATWGTLEKPPQDLPRLSVAAYPQADGYTVDLALPLAFVKARTGEPLEAIGFDLGIDDADLTGRRESQMMWSGPADNYLDPSRFGAIVFGEQTERNVVRVTVH